MGDSSRLLRNVRTYKFPLLQEYKNRISFMKYTILCYAAAFLLRTIGSKYAIWHEKE